MAACIHQPTQDAISVESDVPESGELDLESRRVDVRLSLSR